MLTHPTHDRLLALGLTGIAKALEEQRRSTAFDDLTFEERLGILVDREAAERDGKKLASRLKFAALRQDASVEDLDLRTPRGLDRSVMAHLADGGWIARHENLLDGFHLGAVLFALEAALRLLIVIERPLNPRRGAVEEVDLAP